MTGRILRARAHARAESAKFSVGVDPTSLAVYSLIMAWDTPNIRRLLEQLRKLREDTTSANVGAFPVPWGITRNKWDTGPILVDVTEPPKKKIRTKKK